MKFQHAENAEVTKETYKFVFLQKRQLLYYITKLLKEIEIKFVISHGNLIEYERKKPIFHDDDIDIRFDINDFHKWEKFCNENDSFLQKYNLVFDNRFRDFDSQKHNGIQCKLINFANPYKIRQYDIAVHVDLVPSFVSRSDFWPNYNINYNNLREVELYSVKTFAPSENDSKRVLSSQYGKDFLIPDRPSPFVSRNAQRPRPGKMTRLKIGNYA